MADWGDVLRPQAGNFYPADAQKAVYTGPTKENPQGQGGQAIYGQQQDALRADYNWKLGGKPAFAYTQVEITKPNKDIVVDGKALLWMNSNFQEPETYCFGGCAQACMRNCAGESMCMNVYTTKPDMQQGSTAILAAGFELPGDMLSFGVSKGNGWVLTRRAFIAGTTNIKITGRFAGCCACCVSDEGPFLTKVALDREDMGSMGIFMAGGYGSLVRHDVPEGKTLCVSRGLFFAAHEKVELKIGYVGGLKNLCCSGASVVMKFRGPAVVYTQSRNPADFFPTQGDPMADPDGNGGAAIT